MVAQGDYESSEPQVVLSLRQPVGHEKQPGNAEQIRGTGEVDRVRAAVWLVRLTMVAVVRAVVRRGQSSL